MADKNRSTLQKEGVRPTGVTHHNAKMTPALASDVRRKYATGQHKQRDLAAEFGIAQSTLQNILNNKTWRTGT